MVIHKRTNEKDVDNYFDYIRLVVNDVAATIKAEKKLPDREHCGTREIVTHVYLAALQYDYIALVYRKYDEKFEDKHIKMRMKRKMIVAMKMYHSLDKEDDKE